MEIISFVILWTIDRDIECKSIFLLSSINLFCRLILIASTSFFSFLYDSHSYLFFSGGSGDIHNTQYEKLRQSISLTGSGFINDESSEYILSIYPNAEFFDAYSTHNPRIAAIGAVCIIALTSVLFTLYDYFVRREFDAKKDMLNAKRQFMRFVSHEVRKIYIVYS